MKHRSGMMAAAVALAAMMAGVTQADVFNMPAGQTSLQFVTVGNPGNAADPPTGTALRLRLGAYTYQMGKYDVTVGQYCQFLNAVASDRHLRPVQQLTWPRTMPTIGITQSGSPGSYSYSVTGSYSQGVNCPIFDVTWGDAARFCNWLQNGQPTGTGRPGRRRRPGRTRSTAQSRIRLDGDNPQRRGHRTSFPRKTNGTRRRITRAAVPTRGYWTYPTQSNTAPSNVLSATGTNNANYYD